MKLILSLSFLAVAFLSNAGQDQLSSSQETTHFAIYQYDDRKRKSKKTKRKRRRKCRQYGKKVYAG